MESQIRKGTVIVPIKLPRKLVAATKELSLSSNGNVSAVMPVTGTDGALVDLEDVEKVSRFKWRKSRGYAIAYTQKADGTKTTMRMHRLIMNAKNGEIVDHVNHNELDNRRSNLRICSHAENQRNRRGAQSNSQSGVLGVYWNKQLQKWHAQIRVNRRLIHLGLFDILEDAIAARREAELKYFGSFAGTANQQPNEQTPTRKKPPVREVNPKPDAPPKTEAA